MRLCAVQRLHEVYELLAELRAKSLLFVSGLGRSSKQLLDETVRGLASDIKERVLEGVSALFYKANRVVLYGACKMLEDKTVNQVRLLLLELHVGRLNDAVRLGRDRKYLFQEFRIAGAVSSFDLLIDLGENTCPTRSFNKSDDVFVILKLNLLDVDAFLLVLSLFQLEDVVVEVALELLVTIVDTQLLKRVDFKGLETKDIENTDVALHVLALAEAHVNLLNQPVKHEAVQTLCECVTGICGGTWAVVSPSDVFACLEHTLCESLGKCVRLGTELFSCQVEHVRVCNLTGVVALALVKADVSEVQNTCESHQHLVNVGFVDLDNFQSHLGGLPLISVVDVLNLGGRLLALVEVIVLGSVGEVVLFLEVGIHVCCGA
mmetsp:Transcript_13168/g.23374  ORF Transcript_13168/g.23374 Transcript_13168/m.23374 type:complete len:377 (-) Transcript_13168:1060-2190(-)